MVLLRAVLLALTPMPRPVRYRLRLRAPAAARRADRLADLAGPVLAVLVLLCVAAALSPRLPAGFQRIWLAGAAVGLLTGIPFALERRSLRRRLADLPPPPPLAGAPAAGGAIDTGDPEQLRRRALELAAAGAGRGARAHALRAVQVDPTRWDVPMETGLTLCRVGRFGEGVRLLERAAEMSHRDPRAELALAQGLAAAGRLREAVAARERARAADAHGG